MTEDRWRNFSKHDQLLMIGSELERARVWQGKDDENFKGALKRGLDMVKLSKSDPQWREWQYAINGLELEVQKQIGNESRIEILSLYQAL